MTQIHIMVYNEISEKAYTNTLKTFVVWLHIVSTLIQYEVVQICDAIHYLPSLCFFALDPRGLHTSTSS